MADLTGILARISDHDASLKSATVELEDWIDANLDRGTVQALHYASDPGTWRARLACKTLQAETEPPAKRGRK